MTSSATHMTSMVCVCSPPLASFVCLVVGRQRKVPFLQPLSSSIERFLEREGGRGREREGVRERKIEGEGEGERE